MGGGAAAAGRLAASAAGVLQGGHQGLAGDGTKLVAEGSVENEDVNNEDPLADGGQVLQEEALVDKEDATCGGVKGRSGKKMALPGGCQVPKQGSRGWRQSQGLDLGRTELFCVGEGRLLRAQGSERAGRRNRTRELSASPNQQDALEKDTEDERDEGHGGEEDA